MSVIQHDFRKKSEKEGTGKPDIIPGYRLNFEIGFSSPTIWRQVDICGSLSLAELSRVIQICFGWLDDCAHRFLVGKIFYGPTHTQSRSDLADESLTKLYELEEDMGFVFTFLYDQGGGWECEITLLEKFPKGFKSRRPILYDADRANPAAGINDIHEYNELLNLLEQSPGNCAKLLAHHELPADFDPGYCDKDSITAQFGSFAP